MDTDCSRARNHYKTTIEERCGAIVEKSFEARIEGAGFLITETGTLEPSGNCRAVYQASCWMFGHRLNYPSGSARTACQYCPGMSANAIKRKMIKRNHIEILEESQVIETLKNTRLPRPRSWRQLLHLWNYALLTGVTNFRSDHRSIRVVPGQGRRSALRS